MIDQEEKPDANDPEKYPRLTVRIPARLKASIERLADRDQRTTGNWVVRALSTAVEAELRSSAGPAPSTREARVAESDALAIDDINEESVAEMMARFCCSPAREVTGWVYALGCSSSKLIKIGKTEGHPWKRLSKIITMSGAPLRLLGLAHGATFERDLHGRYAHARRHGEWFEIAENPLPNMRDCATCRMATWPSDVPWDPYALARWAIG